jgi:hypothetical protein
MSASADSNPQDHLFVTGNRCLLLIMGQRFLVSIQKVTDNTIEVSFPVRDFPVEGMRVASPASSPRYSTRRRSWAIFS